VFQIFFLNEKDLKLPPAWVVFSRLGIALLGSLSCARATPCAELQTRSSEAWLAVNEHHGQMIKGSSLAEYQ